MACPVCGKEPEPMERHSALEAEMAHISKKHPNHCFCGQLMNAPGHVQCSRCGIWTGPNHKEKRTYNGVCSDCVNRRPLCSILGLALYKVQVDKYVQSTTGRGR